MTYQVNFHSFVVLDNVALESLSQQALKELESNMPELQKKIDELVKRALYDSFPQLEGKAKAGLGRVEVMYLGL